MKTLIFYGRTQVGSVVLSYLVAKGYIVKVIPEDDIIRDLCGYYNLEIVTLDTMGEFDFFICCHGKKIIDKNYLQDKKFINMHSCLWKYKGKDPIKRYIANKDTQASIESHYLVEEVDGGEVIERVLFNTPVVDSYGDYWNIALPHYYTCIHETMKRLERGKNGWPNAIMLRFSHNKEKLKLWLSYHSKFFDYIIIFGFGQDGKVAEDISDLAQLYKFDYLTDDGNIYSEGAHGIIFEKQKELLLTHDWVMYSDIDEFVIADPAKYTDLKDFMTRSNDEQTFCEGYDVYKTEGELDINYSQPLLKQRGYWYRDVSGSYNKPLLSRIPTRWTLGFHKTSDMADEEIKAVKNTGLYLVHLKHIDDIGPIDNVDLPRAKIPVKFKRFL